MLSYFSGKCFRVALEYKYSAHKLCDLSWNTVISEKNNLLFLTSRNFCLLKYAMVLYGIADSSVSFRCCAFCFDTVTPTSSVCVPVTTSASYFVNICYILGLPKPSLRRVVALAWADYKFPTECCCGWNAVVGIATRCGLDGSWIESRWGRDFPHPSRPALGSTQPPVRWVPGLSRG